MLEKQQIDELEAKHLRIEVVRGEGEKPPWEIVLRKPTRAEYKQFRAHMHDPARIANAQEVLVLKCVVYPDPERLDALLEEWPGIPEAAGDALRRLTGLGAADDTK